MTQKSHIMPGFVGNQYTLLYLCLVVLIPLSTLVFKSLQLSWEDYLAIIGHERVAGRFPRQL